MITGIGANVLLCVTGAYKLEQGPAQTQGHNSEEQIVLERIRRQGRATLTLAKVILEYSQTLLYISNFYKVC